MRIQTDDGPRRLRAVWLGPSNLRMPWDWTYAQWATGLLTYVVVGGLLLMCALPTGDPVLVVAVPLLWPLPAVWYVAGRLLPRHVDPDTPLGWWVAALRGEWRDSTAARRVDRQHRIRPVGKGPVSTVGDAAASVLDRPADETGAEEAS